MPQPADPNQPPETIILGAFDGVRNNVARERLGPKDLEIAKNIDLDDSGQPRRRRGFVQVATGEWHSICTIGSKVYGVNDGQLGIIRPDNSFFQLGVSIGRPPVAYTKVNEDVYFTSPDAQGVIDYETETVSPWGATNGQGFWDSPVYSPTATLGEVAGRLLGDPPKATMIEAFHGHIYLAEGKVLWKTELFRFHYVDRLAGFYQFEHAITMVRAVDDGMYVGTVEGLYFLQEERLLMREFKALKMVKVLDTGVLPGSDVVVPVNLIHPNAQNQAVPTGTSVCFLTNDGICVGLSGGECYNLTQGRVDLPHGVSAAGLFRQDQGVNSYIAAVDSAGAPTANARIGDYVEAELIRAADRQGG